MNKNDCLGNRMKEYEQHEAGRRFMHGVPLVARIDGKCFSKFTRGLERPFDKRLSKMMVLTTSYLVMETRAAIGYTQSDEITLVYQEDANEFFERKIHKIVSVLASMATAKFNSLIPVMLPEKEDKLALFDCRAWMVPSETEATNAVLWREFDATKNSIAMAARCHYSHKQLHGKNGSEMQEMLFQKGINWNDYPAFFKRGTYVKRHRVLRALSPEELEKIPEAHRPEGPVERHVVEKMELPPLNSVTNRTEVLFRGAEPEVDQG